MIKEELLRRKIKEWDPIEFNHPIKVFIPVFQVNPTTETEHPTFTFNMKDASSDETAVASQEPDYILELNGVFDAKTKPYKLVIEEVPIEGEVLTPLSDELSGKG